MVKGSDLQLVVNDKVIGSVPDRPAPTPEEYEKVIIAPHKRYLVFAHNENDSPTPPEGGLYDKMDSFDTLLEAIEYGKNLRYNQDLYTYTYCYVYDRIRGITVEMINEP